MMSLIIRDSDDNTYIRETYLGKGAFSKSYILNHNGSILCGKFIPKNKTHPPDKNLESIQEFSILSRLQHKNIVNFVKCIETKTSFCLITEYYPHKSMFELIQRRTKLTIYEVRYFSKQLLSALKYIHDLNVVHRDIKPQNMLLDSQLNLKLADFGMAVVCPQNGLIFKRHIYGTPNYISPEMITRTISRYNHKVDIWAFGCFLFHMYTGKTPFRGKEEKMLYANIQNCTYTMPSDMATEPLGHLIHLILQKDPQSRPDARTILGDKFYHKGFVPNSLPITALVDKPKFILPHKDREHKHTLNAPGDNCQLSNFSAKGKSSSKNDPTLKYCVANRCLRKTMLKFEEYLGRILNTAAIDKSRESRRHKNQSGGEAAPSPSVYHEIEYPMLAPVVWIRRVSKHGKNVGYSLNDGTTGVLFDDRTVLVLLPNRNNLYYVTDDKQIKFYTIGKPSHSLAPKLTILKIMFHLDDDSSSENRGEEPATATSNSAKSCKNSTSTSSSQNPTTRGGASKNENSDWLPMLPYLQSFYETTKYYIMLMSNGLYQITSKVGDITLLLCMKTSGFSVMVKGGKLKTYDLHYLCEFKFPDGLLKHLQITHSSLRRILSKEKCFACKKALPPTPPLNTEVPKMQIEGNDKQDQKSVPQPQKLHKTTCKIKPKGTT